VLAAQLIRCEGMLRRHTVRARRRGCHEVQSGESECLAAAALPSHPAGDVLVTDHALLSMSRRVPVGVVGVIAPFNGPVKLAIRSVAPALALGNAVVLKPDPRTAVCGGSLSRGSSSRRDSPPPPGVLHVLAGGGDAARQPTAGSRRFSGPAALPTQPGEITTVNGAAAQADRLHRQQESTAKPAPPGNRQGHTLTTGTSVTCSEE
jgi:benzaldehyde dehydrogenase (NAD)